MWVQLAFFVVSVLVNAIFAANQKPPAGNMRPATEKDFKLPTAEEGLAIPVIFGTCLVKAPDTAWWGDLKIEKIKKKMGSKK